MAIIQGNAKQGSTRGFYPKIINGSLRFNDDDGAYLSWTPASAGNRKTWTWSGWVKRCELNDTNLIFDCETASDYNFFGLTSANVLQFRHSTNFDVATLAVFRDPSAWYHIVVQFDSTQSTATDRRKIYVNGVLQALTITNEVDLNADGFINSTNPHYLGSNYVAAGLMDGYLANVHFIDGQALTASDFGETKNGVWVAKDYAGTFGTNGFYLTFEDDTQVEAFNTVLWRGNGGTQSVTGVGFQPDLVWTKSRSQAYWHTLYDSVRGAGNALFSNDPNQETPKTNEITAFDSDGFTFGNSVSFNESAQTYVAWCWKAGDSNVSNTDGTITSTVRANDTYGFSIVSYTGTGTNGNWGHGLSAAPDMVIVKNRDNGGMPWLVYHSSNTANPETDYLLLNSTAATTDFNTAWNDTPPTSTVFNVGTADGTNQSGYKHIAYCWSETTGYSKFGSYTGDATTDGSLAITTGFKPSLVIIKRTDSANDWTLIDSTRDTSNPSNVELLANSSSAEGTAQRINFTDTGFALVNNGGRVNASGGTYIYAAFADTREAAFWLDQSGNDNDWQPVNLDHNDTVADSPTNNFATWNPLIVGTGTFADGNLSVTTTVDKATSGTILSSSGQHYCEIICTSATTIANARLGVVNDSGIGTNLGGNANTWAYLADARVYHNGSASSYGTTLAVGDVFQIALDIDAGKVWYGINGTWMASGDPSTGDNPSQTFTANQSMTFAVASGSGTFTFVANFGQQPFKYDPPE